MVNRFEGVIEFGVQGVVGATDDIVVVEFATAWAVSFVLVLVAVVVFATSVTIALVGVLFVFIDLLLLSLFVFNLSEFGVSFSFDLDIRQINEHFFLSLLYLYMRNMRKILRNKPIYILYVFFYNVANLIYFYILIMSRINFFLFFFYLYL